MDTGNHISKLKLKWLFSICLVMLLTPEVDSQEAGLTKLESGKERIERFTNEQGFFQNTVNALVSDDDGYLWIGTPNGLIKYNGYQFKYYYSDSDDQYSIRGNFITHLTIDSNNRPWIATRQGASVYNGLLERFEKVGSAFSSQNLMESDGQNRVWIGSGKVLEVFTFAEGPKKIAELDFGELVGGDNIVGIQFLSASAFLSATDNGIYMVDFDPADVSDFKVTELSFDKDEIEGIALANNTIWIGSSSGIFQTFLEKDRLTIIKTFFEKEKGQNSLRSLDIYEDSNKNIWISTGQDGIVKYNPGEDELVAYPYDSESAKGLSSGRINCFFEDAFGVLWIGTAHGGLNKLDNNQKKFYSYSHNSYDETSLPADLITDITEGDDGSVWLSHFDKGISRTFRPLTPETGSALNFQSPSKKLSVFSDKSVTRIFQDSGKNWWVRLRDGLFYYNESNQILRKVKFSLNGAIETSVGQVIAEINEAKLLIIGSKVLLIESMEEAVIAGNPIEIGESVFDVGVDNSINGYLQDQFGNNWFATRNGIYRVEQQEGKWEVLNHYTSETKPIALSNTNIFTMHADQKKNLWVGSFGGGLMKIALDDEGKPNGINHFGRNDGLPDDAVYGILEDKQGMLWISTDMGICRFNPTTENFEVYDVNDGVLNYNFRRSAYLKTTSGMILMGGVNGLTVFNPEEIRENPIHSKVHIERLKVNGKLVVAGRPIEDEIILKEAISTTNNLELKYENRNISFDISALHTAAPKKNQVAYMLRGFEQEWTEVNEGEVTANYTNLRPGSYQFMYKSANGDGFWIKDPRVLNISILAPWYLKWYSILLWIALIGTIVYSVFIYRVRMEKLNQQLNFGRLDNERVREMEQAKIRFFTNISHDLKTPLALIIGPLEKIASHAKTEDQKYFSMIQTNISRLTRMVDQILLYRKAETEHLEISTTQITLGDFMYPLMEAFEDYSQRANVNFYFKVGAPNQVMNLDVGKMERVIMNLFSNAIKYSQPNDDIRIETFIEEVADGSSNFFISIADTGIAIDPDQLERIFDRFYRAVDERKHWSGIGIGLALCKSLVSLMKGTITVESKEGKGTNFSVSIPISLTEASEEDSKSLESTREISLDWMPIQSDETDLEEDDSKPVILIVDDESDIRLFLKEAFRDHYNVVLAKDGEEGWEQLTAVHPQLVISDVLMPKLSGYDLTKRIKSNPEYDHIPVILLTAIDEEDKKVKALELGADDHIDKPFSIKHLEVKVRKLIENKQRVLEFYSKNSEAPPEYLEILNKDRQFMENLTLVIQENMSNSSFGVEELAREVGVSTSHFYRRLKELTGQSPNSYLRNFRLGKAAELLNSQADLTASQIMYKIGIESPSYFSTSFKKLYGVSPSEYAKSLSESN